MIDYSITRQNIKVFPKIEKMKEDENRIKEEMCSMMNSYGGVILFDCELNKRDILALG